MIAISALELDSKVIVGKVVIKASGSKRIWYVSEIY